MGFVRALWAHVFGYSRDNEVSALSSSKSYGDIKNIEYVSNHDGDTFTANIKGFPSVCGELVPVRVNGIDTPEMTDPRSKIKALAEQAKVFTATKLKEAKRIELRAVRRDKYFRLLADVYVDDRKLADLLLAAGLAKPYDGGTKSSW
jgi:endonuclease YncB( thermonuclease family)